jgi:hypothetical protein
MSPTDLEFALNGGNTSDCLLAGSRNSRRSAALVCHLVAGRVDVAGTSRVIPVKSEVSREDWA